ncbi:MAG TPA: hypothetical protein VJL28_02080 [Gemmatimonadaceae bacterium]|nr:hypothetical protein [Gemmatimonadaceae bacterium]
MKKALLVVSAVIGAALVVFLGSSFFFAQRADYGWDPAVAQPSFTSKHPRVLFDEGHHNASSAGFSGRYWPFARLLRADGYAVERGHGTFTPAYLDGVQVLVIANASGAPKPQLFGINLPVATDKPRSDPAFTAPEIEAVRAWVEGGGSLLLIGDHAPFGEAASALGDALDVTMHKGFVEVPGEPSDPLLFSVGNGRLGDHPIITGDRSGTKLARVMTYTGQSLDGPPGATALLRLPDAAVESVPIGGDVLAQRPAGRAQALAFELGRGRIVVLGEGGMVTAQVSGRVLYGINTGDNDNRQFVLNVMHWLSRQL